MRVGSGEYQYDVIHGWGNGLAAADIAGVGVDSEDYLYVLNRSVEHPVVVLDPQGAVVRTWGHGLFRRAHALLVGPDDVVYCVDDQGHSLRKFTSEGQPLLEISTADHPADTGYVPGKLRTVVRSGPPFNTPTGVALSPNGEIVVSDGYGNARIHQFSAAGDLICSFGEPGNGPGQFFLPHGVAVDRRGSIYVADRENSRVQVFRPDGSFIAQWRSPRASSILIDARENLFVTEMGEVMQGPPGNKHLVVENAKPSITVRDLDGEILAQLPAEDPEGDGLFFAPHSIATDSLGNLFVSEVSTSYSGGLAPKDRPRLHKYVRV